MITYTFEKLQINLANPIYKIFGYFELSFIDSNNIKILAVRDSDYKLFLMESNNGGQTWKQDTTIFDDIPESMLFLSNLDGWIAGAKQNGTGSVFSDIIYHTIDGGNTWNKVLDTLVTRLPSGLDKIVFSDSLNGMAMGYYGRLWRTRDGGVHWVNEDTKIDGNGNYAFHNIAMPTSNIVFGVCDFNGKIFKYDSNIYTYVSDKEEKRDDILIFPNPIYTGQDISIKFNLQISENIKFILINSLGNIVDASDEFFLTSGEHTINFNPKDNLPDGVYLLKIIKNGIDIIIKAFVILK